MKDSTLLRDRIREISYNEDYSLQKKAFDVLMPEVKRKRMDYLQLMIYSSQYEMTLGSNTEESKAEREKIVSEVKKIFSTHKDAAVKGAYFTFIGTNELYYGDRKKAYEYLFNAAKISKDIDVINYLNSSNKLKYFAIEVRDFDTAILLEQAFLKYCKKDRKQDKMLSESYRALAKLFTLKKDPINTKKYLDSAEYAKKMYGTPPSFYIEETYGRLAFLKGNYNEALQYYNKDIAKCKSEGKEYPDSHILKLVVFDKMKQKDSITKEMSILKDMEQEIFTNRDISFDYYPLKIKHTTGEEQKRAMEGFLTLQKNILEENAGIITAKYRYEKEISDQKQHYETTLAQKKKNDLIKLFVGLSTILLLLYLIFIYRNQKRKLQIKNKNLEMGIMNSKFEAITRERNRISKELHDDLGAAFTSISMATQMVKERPEKTQTYLDVIYTNSNRISEKINEIVWSLNTRNDNLGSLCGYIKNFAKRFFEPTSIDLKIHTANSIDTHKEKFVHADKRRMIYLTSKEILNNIVKHAEAKSTTIELVLDDVSNFSIKITDDGKGININENHTGNGLKNIAENLKHINGSYHYETSNNGTEFLVSVKI